MHRASVGRDQLFSSLLLQLIATSGFQHSCWDFQDLNVFFYQISRRFVVLLVVLHLFHMWMCTSKLHLVLR